jgi:hypothetical protein
VPEVVLHLFHVAAVGDEDGGTGMAQVVEAQSLGDGVPVVGQCGRVCLLHLRAEVATVEVAVPRTVSC